MSYKDSLILSFVLGAASFAARWVVPSPRTFPAGFVLICGVLGIIWLVLLAHSVSKFGSRGYWTLLAAPLVVFWPLMATLAIYGCTWGNADCS